MDASYRSRTLLVGVAAIFLIGSGCAGHPLSSSKDWLTISVGGITVPSEVLYGNNAGSTMMAAGNLAYLHVSGDQGETQGVPVLPSAIVTEGTCSNQEVKGMTTSTNYAPGALDGYAAMDKHLFEAVGRGGGIVCGTLIEYQGKWVATALTFMLTAEQKNQLSQARSKDAAAQAEREAAIEAKQAQAEEERQAEIAAWQKRRHKGPLPEEAERNRILAENAVREKQFSMAIKYYEAGLHVERLWPEGHYNAALLYGELNNYRMAADHMRWYLDLVPDAKDAQMAKEKLIIWEEKAPKTQKTRRGFHPQGQ